jgi:hypothetical protein
VANDGQTCAPSARHCMRTSISNSMSWAAGFVNSMSWAAGFEERLGQVIFWGTRFENRLEVRGNRTGRGWFVKGHSGNPSGRSKNPPSEFAPSTDNPDGADRRTVGNLVIEARKFSGLAVDTLVELTKDNHTDSTRFAAATALLDRGYGRPAQSLDLHLSADAITKRLSDMTDAELAALEARMIAIPAALALEHADEPQADGDTDAGQDGDGCADDEGVDDEVGNST